MTTFRLRTLLVGAAVTAIALSASPAATAVAAPSTGWLRLAHLSPDTTAVDVRVAPLDRDGTVVAIDDVSYGAVSDYRSLPAGEYAVAMRPAGASASSTPVVESSVTVSAGDASTIAVFGKNADLTTRILDDDLALPARGEARVRVVQASTSSNPVTVTAAPDTTIVTDAATTTVSPYADVRAGKWALTATNGAERATSTIDLRAGQIASVFVLDDASGGIVLRPVVDSASVGGVPKGYLATGGGYLVHEQALQRTHLLLVFGAVGLLAAAAAAVGFAARRTRARA